MYNKKLIIFTEFFKLFFLQVDHSRVNEFGYSGEMLDEAQNKTEITDENPPQKQIEAKKKD